MGTKLYIKTYGCQMNEYDTQKTVEILKKEKNIELTQSLDDAEIILLNTCSIREKAEEKVYSELGRINKLKEMNPNLKIGVGGCVASQEGENIFKRAPYVDLIFGPQTLHKVPELLDQEDKIKAVDVSFPIEEKFDSLLLPEASGPSSFVSIMEGCSKFCTFCVVPYTRGEEVSRKPRQIFDEVARLAEQGVKEIVFVGQNVNRYKYVPQLVDHLHLPVQSGSDKVLLDMKRNYSFDDYLSIIQKLKKIRPSIKISSDFIVGFPTETKEDFKMTMNLVNEVKFDASFSFIFSARPGTPAAKLGDCSTLDEKKERLYELQSRLNEFQASYSKELEGTIQRCLVTDLSKKDSREMQARTECNRVVNFHFQNPNILGKLVDIKIDEALSNSLKGTLL